MQVKTVVAALPVTEQRLMEYRKAQGQDKSCSRIMQFCAMTWPEKKDIALNILPFWKVRDCLTMHNWLLLYNNHIVVPKVMQQETMRCIHKGHQGI